MENTTKILLITKKIWCFLILNCNDNWNSLLVPCSMIHWSIPLRKAQTTVKLWENGEEEKLEFQRLWINSMQTFFLINKLAKAELLLQHISFKQWKQKLYKPSYWEPLKKTTGLFNTVSSMNNPSPLQLDFPLFQCRKTFQGLEQPTQLTLFLLSSFLQQCRADGGQDLIPHMHSFKNYHSAEATVRKEKMLSPEPELFPWPWMVTNIIFDLAG